MGEDGPKQNNPPTLAVGRLLLHHGPLEWARLLRSRVTQAGRSKAFSTCKLQWGRKRLRSGPVANMSNLFLACARGTPPVMYLDGVRASACRADPLGVATDLLSPSSLGTCPDSICFMARVSAIPARLGSAMVELCRHYTTFAMISTPYTSC